MQLTNVPDLLTTLGSQAIDSLISARSLSSNSLSPGLGLFSSWQKVQVQFMAKSTSFSAGYRSLSLEAISQVTLFPRGLYFALAVFCFSFSLSSQLLALLTYTTSAPPEMQRQQPSRDTFTCSCNCIRTNLYNKGLFYITS